MATDRRPSRPSQPAASRRASSRSAACCSRRVRRLPRRPARALRRRRRRRAQPSRHRASSLVTPGPSKLSGPDAAETYTGVLSFDSIEGGCAYLQAAVGRKLEVIYPDGWTLQKSPLELLAPDGSVHSRAGDTVTVKGSEATDMASICQIGAIIRATEVLDR